MWTPDRAALIIDVDNADTGWDLYLLRLDAGSQRTQRRASFAINHLDHI